MKNKQKIHDSLLRQIQRAGIEEKELLSIEAMNRLIRSISNTYHEHEIHKYTTERSFEIVSEEMQELYAEIEKEKNKFQTTLTDAVLITDSKWFIKKHNEGASKLFNLGDKNDLLDKHLEETIKVYLNNEHPINYNKVVENTCSGSSFISKRAGVSSFSLSTDTTICDIKISPFMISGTVEEYILYFRDLSEQLNTEKKLSETARSLQQCKETARNFIDGISMDFKEPLHLTKGLLECCKYYRLPSIVDSMLNLCDTAISRQIMIIKYLSSSLEEKSHIDLFDFKEYINRFSLAHFNKKCISTSVYETEELEVLTKNKTQVESFITLIFDLFESCTAIKLIDITSNFEPRFESKPEDFVSFNFRVNLYNSTELYKTYELLLGALEDMTLELAFLKQELKIQSHILIESNTINIQLKFPCLGRSNLFKQKNSQRTTPQGLIFIESQDLRKTVASMMSSLSILTEEIQGKHTLSEKLKVNRLTSNNIDYLVMDNTITEDACLFLKRELKPYNLKSTMKCYILDSNKNKYKPLKSVLSCEFIEKDNFLQDLNFRMHSRALLFAYRRPPVISNRSMMFDYPVLLFDPGIKDAIDTKIMLLTLGCRIQTFQSLEELSFLTQNNQINFVILPSEICRQQIIIAQKIINHFKKNITKFENTSLIALSSNITKETHQELLKLGVNEVLTKPFSLNDLRNTLLKWRPQ